MKRLLRILCAMALLFTACHDDPSIVGKWQVTSDEQGNDYVNNIVTYTFQEDHTGLFMAQYPNDSTNRIELNWEMMHDTLVISEAHLEYPVMPMMALVRKLTEQEMTWGVFHWGTGEVVQTELKRI